MELEADRAKKKPEREEELPGGQQEDAMHRAEIPRKSIQVQTIEGIRTFDLTTLLAGLPQGARPKVEHAEPAESP